MHNPGSGRKPINPSLIDNKKYKKSVDDLEDLKKKIPKIDSHELKPPKELTSGAKREWKRIMKLYEELPEQILCDLDTELLKSYCIYVDMRNQLYRECSQIERNEKEKQGNLFYVSVITSASTTNNQNGATQRVGQIKKTVINPILREIRQIEGRITVLSNELCLTPAGRTRMGLARQQKEKDPLDQFYNEEKTIDD